MTNWKTPDGLWPTTFIDFESSDRDPQTAEITEIGAIRVEFERPRGNTRGLNLIITDSLEVKTFPLKGVVPEAAEVNGYTEDKWAQEAVPLIEGLTSLGRLQGDYKVYPRTERSTFAAWNITFDYTLWTLAHIGLGLRKPGPLGQVDVAGVCEPIYRTGLVPNRRLESIGGLLGAFDGGQKHTALDDIRGALWCYAWMLKANEVIDQRSNPKEDLVPPPGWLTHRIGGRPTAPALSVQDAARHEPPGGTESTEAHTSQAQAEESQESLPSG